MIQPDDTDLTSWSRSARGRGYEDGYKKRDPQLRFLTEVPPEVRDAYLAGYVDGKATRDAADAFRRTHGPRPRF